MYVCNRILPGFIDILAKGVEIFFIACKQSKCIAFTRKFSRECGAESNGRANDDPASLWIQRCCGNRFRGIRHIILQIWVSTILTHRAL